MGVLIVNCPNRPKDEVIDCGVYGLHLNMHSHNIDAINGELVIGFPVEKNQKLPIFHEDDKFVEKADSARAQSIGAVLGSETSGILSTDLPGGNPIEEEASPPPAKPSEAKPPQTKEGGE